MSDLEQTIQEAKRIAQSPEGKSLASRLQQMGGTSLQDALQSAAAGDPTDAKHLLTQLLRDPQARQLLEQLGGSYGK